MASSDNNIIMAEGHSLTRPPLFDSTNFAYWRDRMSTYLKSFEFKMWLVIQNGEAPFTKTVENQTVVKNETE